MSTGDTRPCEFCGHTGHWHRLDDSLNVSPTDPEANFRCLGPYFEGCEHFCPDFAREEGR